MFRCEMHLHTVACSDCARSDVEEMIAAAKECGYGGVVITNHFFRGNTCVKRKLPWSEFVDAYKQDYLRGKAMGEKLGVKVFFGVEEVYEAGKEALIYGLTPELIEAVPEWRDWGIAEMSEYVRKNGGFIAAAHPFRARSYIPDPNAEPDVDKFDAIEVYNQFNLPDENEKAEKLAAKTGIPCISGGDVHRAGELGDAGVAFFEDIADDESLVRALKAGAYRLIVGGEIQY